MAVPLKGRAQGAEAAKWWRTHLTHAKPYIQCPPMEGDYYLDCDDSFIGIQTAKMYPVFLFKYAVYSTALTSELYRFLLVSGTESSHIPSPQNNSEVNKT